MLMRIDEAQFIDEMRRYERHSDNHFTKWALLTLYDYLYEEEGYDYILDAGTLYSKWGEYSSEQELRDDYSIEEGESLANLLERLEQETTVLEVDEPMEDIRWLVRMY